MTDYLNLSPNDIQQLSDTDLRELIARLAQAEVATSGYSASAVTFGGDQRATDGGIDVRVSLALEQSITGYIPAPQSGFQVKAEKFARSDIIAEMMPTGQLRNSIIDLIKANGAYIIASSKSSVSDRALSDRIAAMKECVSGADLDGAFKVDFYDCQRIASWTEKFPSLIAWVRGRIGRGSQGWQGYGAWAYKETDANAEYVLDDLTKIFAPSSDAPITAWQAINQLRSDLSKSGTCIRITGLSGVGKTRLAQALFDERISSEAGTCDKTNVLYADNGDSPSPLPVHMIEALISRGDKTIVIVDNCSSEHHSRLAEKVKSSGRLSLVTIEYDIRDDAPDSTLCYRLEPSSDDLIKKILGSRYPNLSGPDIETISQFSGGNPRIAIAIADTAEASGQLSKLKDDALFQRLFRQANGPDAELQRAAEVCSLLYSFEGELTEGNEAELPMLGKLLEITPYRLMGYIGELKRRGLIQQRGRWRAVLPHALANRLADRALQSFTPELLSEVFVTNGTDRIARSFSRRIGYLHDVPIAKLIAKKWLSNDGLLGSPNNLTDLGVDMFCNIAPVDLESVIASIRRAAENTEFTAADRYSRHKFIRVLRGAAYDPSFFVPSVETLMLFSTTEKGIYGNREATDALASLFFIHFSGTMASPEERARFVKSALASPEPRRQAVGLNALQATLKTANFYSLNSFEFGSLPRSYGWHPASPADVELWFTTFLDIAIEFGAQATPHGKTIRSIVGQKFGSLWWRTKLFGKLSEVVDAFIPFEGWPDGWQGVKAALLRAPKENPPETAIELLRRIEQKLLPNDLVTEVRALLLSKGNPTVDIQLLGNAEDVGSAGGYPAWQSKMRDLGRRVGCAPDVLSNLVADLIGRHDKLSWDFGVGVGETLQDPIELLNEVRSAVSDAVSEELSLGFVVAFLHGAQTEHSNALSKYMDFCVDDDVWGPHFPRLQAALTLDEAAVDRLIRSSKLGKTAAIAFSALAGGGATNTLSPRQITQIISAVSAMVDGAQSAASILTMVVHLADKKSEDYNRELRICCRRFLLSYDWSVATRRDDVSDEIAEFGLRDSDAGDDAAAIALKIKQELKAYQYHRVRDVLAALFRNHAIAVLNAIFAPDKDGDDEQAGAMLSGSDWNSRPAPINSASPSDVMSWCSEHRTARISFVANHCTLFDQPDEEHATGWSAMALALLDHSEDRTATFAAFTRRFPPGSWSGSRANILRSRSALIDQIADRYPGFPKGDIQRAKIDLENLATLYERQEIEMQREADETFE
ncbi:hypothetical protein I6F11_13820 [Ensifer sp. NBAIM29]|nr:hypothetical protein [Ensifer sp. NBAIM29]